MPPLQSHMEEPAGDAKDAFSIWLHEYGKASLYTRLDGQKDESSELAQLTQSAQNLREETKSQISRVIKEFSGLSTEDMETCLRYVRDMPIFPVRWLILSPYFPDTMFSSQGLTAYTFTHLQLCAPRGSNKSVYKTFAYRRSQLDSLIERWVRLGDEWCISCYYMIEEKLLDILRDAHVRADQHRCNTKLIDGTKLLKEDILNLAVLAAMAVTGPSMKHVLTTTAAQAKALLLETEGDFDEWLRRCCLNALVTLARANGIYPSNIFLNEGRVEDLTFRTRGGFGLVFEGCLNSRAVAVKEYSVTRESDLQSLMKDLCNEAVMWRHLHHPNCLPFYGIYQIPGQISVSLVSPWMRSGTLLSYLAANPEANRTLLVLDVVRGLHHLHSMKPHIAHRDLKPENIVVSNNGRACLADFGVMRVFDSQAHLRTATVDLNVLGTLVYMAPELHMATTGEEIRTINKRACDLYALGFTVYATYTGQHAFRDIIIPGVVSGMVIQGQRPEFRKDAITPDMWSFIEMLWDQDPSTRRTTEVALAWMEHKATLEKLDTSRPAFDQDWDIELMGGKAKGGPFSLGLGPANM
ncbi:kinase-like domain-containing protein [Phlebopus sp. FC_14]|nr:kinase-like domain-containing protein [Phlebopus sp. FC_14]